MTSYKYTFRPGWSYAGHLCPIGPKHSCLSHLIPAVLRVCMGKLRVKVIQWCDLSQSPLALKSVTVVAMFFCLWLLGCLLKGKHIAYLFLEHTMCRVVFVTVSHWRCKYLWTGKFYGFWTRCRTKATLRDRKALTKSQVYLPMTWKFLWSKCFHSAFYPLPVSRT